MTINVIIDGHPCTLKRARGGNGGNSYAVLNGDTVEAIHTFPTHFKLEDNKGKTFRTGGHRYQVI